MGKKWKNITYIPDSPKKALNILLRLKDSIKQYIPVRKIENTKKEIVDLNILYELNKINLYIGYAVLILNNMSKEEYLSAFTYDSKTNPNNDNRVDSDLWTLIKIVLSIKTTENQEQETFRVLRNYFKDDISSLIKFIKPTYDFFLKNKMKGCDPFDRENPKPSVEERSSYNKVKNNFAKIIKTGGFQGKKAKIIINVINNYLLYCDLKELEENGLDLSRFSYLEDKLGLLNGQLRECNEILNKFSDLKPEEKQIEYTKTTTLLSNITKFIKADKKSNQETKKEFLLLKKKLFLLREYMLAYILDNDLETTFFNSIDGIKGIAYNGKISEAKKVYILDDLKLVFDSNVARLILRLNESLININTLYLPTHYNKAGIEAVGYNNSLRMIKRRMQISLEKKDIEKIVGNNTLDFIGSILSAVFYRYGKDVCDLYSPKCAVCSLKNKCSYYENEKSISGEDILPNSILNRVQKKAASTSLITY